MIEFFTVFFAGFFSVFLLGFQSRLVNTSNYIGAAICSFTIAMFQVSLWSHLMAAQVSSAATIAYGLSGSTGIVAAIFTHKKIFPKAKYG
jgi:hypothetical protein